MTHSLICGKGNIFKGRMVTANNRTKQKQNQNRNKNKGKIFTYMFVYFKLKMKKAIIYNKYADANNSVDRATFPL